jgi:hypothetical protein
MIAGIQTVDAQSCTPSDYPIQYEAVTLLLQYQISDCSNIEAITIDQEFASIIITLESTSENVRQLSITLPRALIDAKQGDLDTKFQMLVDGESSSFSEITATDMNGRNRTLTTDIPPDANEVEIVGTQVVPEFPVSVFLISAALVGLATAFSRNRDLKI